MNTKICTYICIYTSICTYVYVYVHICGPRQAEQSFTALLWFLPLRLPGKAVNSGRSNTCNPLRPLINILCLRIPYGCIIFYKRITREIPGTATHVGSHREDFGSGLSEQLSPGLPQSVQCITTKGSRAQSPVQYGLYTSFSTLHSEVGPSGRWIPNSKHHGLAVVTNQEI